MSVPTSMLHKPTAPNSKFPDKNHKNHKTTYKYCYEICRSAARQTFTTRPGTGALSPPTAIPQPWQQPKPPPVAFPAPSVAPPARKLPTPAPVSTSTVWPAGIVSQLIYTPNRAAPIGTTASANFQGSIRSSTRPTAEPAAPSLLPAPPAPPTPGPGPTAPSATWATILRLATYPAVVSAVLPVAPPVLRLLYARVARVFWWWLVGFASATPPKIYFTLRGRAWFARRP